MGKLVGTYPGLRGMVLNSVRQAELRLGRPVNRNEVYIQSGMSYYLRLPVILVWIIIQDLWRDDQILANKEVTVYSVNPEMQNTLENPTGFELYSDCFARLYPTYTLDARLRIVPGPETPTVNFNTLKEILLSTDLERNSELAWIEKGLRFLDGSVDMTGNRVCFASYPRTGNTMTRNYVEAVSGIFSGSDMNL
jgi:hypothetical protein